MRILVALSFLAVSVMPVFAEPVPRYLYLTPFAGFHTQDEDFRPLGGPLDDAPYFGGRLGWQAFSRLGFEVAAGTTPTEGTTLGGTTFDADFAHVSFDLLLYPLGQRPFAPFLLLGAGPAHTKHSLGDEAVEQLRASYGLGANLWFGDRLGLRLEGRGLAWIPKEDWDKTDVNEWLLGAGLTVALGGRARDADGDGVGDGADRCPETPRGVLVDARGCPLDNDRDGVADGIDQCPDSPAGARVDPRGCPMDSDGDGVIDGVDACEGTPRGARVDPRGCPTDTDGDGVPDGIDRCPDTPRGVAVTDSGCVGDGDRDGITDDRDRCPNTPVGALVDSTGCPPGEAALERELTTTGRVALEDVRFESGLAVLMNESMETLNEIGRVLARLPQLNVEIGGHTDSRGTAAANRTLSLRRAEAVRDYLFAEFPELDRARFTVRGYGEDRPVASNGTEQGRARNRRVEFTVRPGLDRRPERMPAQPDRR